jgi:hypothetical protein
MEFIKESIPPVHVSGGAGRLPNKWEEDLAPLKEHQGEAFRIFTYGKRTAATSRMAVIRNRLALMTPHDNWQLAIRKLPDGMFGCYACYVGPLTDEEVAVREAKRQERSNRIKAQRQAVSDLF